MTNQTKKVKWEKKFAEKFDEMIRLPIGKAERMWKSFIQSQIKQAKRELFERLMKMADLVREGRIQEADMMVTQIRKELGIKLKKEIEGE